MNAKGQKMRRFVTYRNFPLLDLQIEQAYRRRCDGGAVAVLADIEDVASLGSLREARRRCKRSRNWLRRLAWEMDALTKKPDRDARRRSSSRLVVANATHRDLSTTGKTRHGRAGR